MSSFSEESFGIVPLRRIDGHWHVFIILHKHGNHWGFPKGNPDHGEDAHKSAARELTEETGLVVEKYLTEAPISEEYSFYREGRKVDKKVHYFPALVTGTFVLQPEEVRDGKWLPLQSVKGELTFEEARKICDQVEKILSL